MTAPSVSLRTGPTRAATRRAWHAPSVPTPCSGGPISRRSPASPGGSARRCGACRSPGWKRRSSITWRSPRLAPSPLLPLIPKPTMAAKDRLSVLLAMMDQGVIPVFYHPDVEVCTRVIQACANGGAKCIEFTNRGDFATHVFYEVTKHFDKADPSVIMGVGSVVDASTAAIFI